MSGSHLRRRDEHYSVYESEVGRWTPSQQSGSYGEYRYTDVPSHRGGKEQVENALDLLFRRKWTILISFIIVLAGAATYSFTRTPRYEASSYVSVDLGTRTIIDAAPSGVGDNLFARSDRTLPGEIRLLQISDQLQTRVAQRIAAIQNGISLNDNSETIENLTAGLRSGRVEFYPERQTENIIEIRGIGTNPEQAALLSKLYAEEYVQLTQQASLTYISALRQSLEDSESERLEELNDIEGQIRAYLSREGAVGLDLEGTRLVQQIASLETQQDDLGIKLRTEQALLDNLENEISSINPNIAARISSERLAAGLEQRIEDVQALLADEENDLSKILRANPGMRDRNLDVLEPYNRRIRLLRVEVDSLSTLYVAEATSLGASNSGQDGLTYLATLRQQASEKRILISGLEAQLEVVDTRLGGYQRELSDLPGQSMELTQLERSRLHAERLYQYVVERLQEARIAEESEPGYAQIIRTALIPILPVYPDPVRDLILGTLLGLLLGFGLAVIKEKLDNRIYQSRQVREQGFREIAVIPNLRPLIEKDHNGQEFMEVDGQRLSTSLVSLVNPISAASEAFRSVRTFTQFSQLDKNVQTMLISSPGMGEGKSTTAANLAIVMAQAGRKTLLIDADLRRPQQHRLFGLNRESGLVELISNGKTVDEASWKTFVDNLFVLTAHHSVGNSQENVDSEGEGENGHLVISNPSELLGSHGMDEFLKIVKGSFDTIIFDSPPVLAATDAALLSTKCDATIVVARTGYTKEGELDYTMEAFNDVGAKVMGVILNAFDISMAYGHKYRYRHYTKYGRYSKYGDSQNAGA
ncbi:MAG: AAA family ATPase [Bacteroidetes bacterium]|nr:AAA family ATPase [Bacteroidota bacterium]